MTKDRGVNLVCCFGETVTAANERGESEVWAWAWAWAWQRIRLRVSGGSSQFRIWEGHQGREEGGNWLFVHARRPQLNLGAARPFRSLLQHPNRTTTSYGGFFRPRAAG